MLDSNVVKFPSGVSRKAQSRKPRRSENGTPEERAANSAQEMTGSPVHLDLWSGRDKFIALGDE
jgi:hypothetical protein